MLLVVVGFVVSEAVYDGLMREREKFLKNKIDNDDSSIFFCYDDGGVCVCDDIKKQTKIIIYNITPHPQATQGSIYNQ